MKKWILFCVKSETNNYEMINKAIEEETGYTNWFDSQKDLENSISKGYTEIVKNNGMYEVIIYGIK